MRDQKKGKKWGTKVSTAVTITGGGVGSGKARELRAGICGADGFVRTYIEKVSGKVFEGRVCRIEAQGQRTTKN